MKLELTLPIGLIDFSGMVSLAKVSLRKPTLLLKLESTMTHDQFVDWSKKLKKAIPRVKIIVKNEDEHCILCGPGYVFSNISQRCLKEGSRVARNQGLSAQKDEGYKGRPTVKIMGSDNIKPIRSQAKVKEQNDVSRSVPSKKNNVNRVKNAVTISKQNTINEEPYLNTNNLVTSVPKPIIKSLHKPIIDKPKAEVTEVINIEMPKPDGIAIVKSLPKPAVAKPKAEVVDSEIPKPDILINSLPKPIIKSLPKPVVDKPKAEVTDFINSERTKHDKPKPVGNIANKPPKPVNDKPKAEVTEVTNSGKPKPDGTVVTAVTKSLPKPAIAKPQIDATSVIKKPDNFREQNNGDVQNVPGNKDITKTPAENAEISVQKCKNEIFRNKLFSFADFEDKMLQEQLADCGSIIEPEPTSGRTHILFANEDSFNKTNHYNLQKQYSSKLHNVYNIAKKYNLDIKPNLKKL
jgi:hypothetical protein